MGGKTAATTDPILKERTAAQTLGVGLDVDGLGTIGHALPFDILDAGTGWNYVGSLLNWGPADFFLS